MENEKIKKDYFLPVSILVAALLIAGSIVYSVGKKTAPAANPLAADLAGNLPNAKPDASAAVWLGSPSASVSLIEYGDFQCPVCGAFFSEVYPSLKKDYIDTGKVKIAYLDFAFLGPESLLAAEATHCAADQGKFWEYFDILYSAEIADNKENNNNLTADFLNSLAQQLKLNTADFNSCLVSEKYKDRVGQATNQGQQAGVRATPTFFINDQKLEGLDSYDPYGKIKLIIDSELKKT